MYISIPEPITDKTSLWERLGETITQLNGLVVTPELLNNVASLQVIDGSPAIILNLGQNQALEDPELAARVGNTTMLYIAKYIDENKVAVLTELVNKMLEDKTEISELICTQINPPT